MTTTLCLNRRGSTTRNRRVSQLSCPRCHLQRGTRKMQSSRINITKDSPSSSFLFGNKVNRPFSMNSYVIGQVFCPSLFLFVTRLRNWDLLITRRLFSWECKKRATVAFIVLIRTHLFREGRHGRVRVVYCCPACITKHCLFFSITNLSVARGNGFVRKLRLLGCSLFSSSEKVVSLPLSSLVAKYVNDCN